MIKLNIDSQKLKEKPATFDGRLRNRLCSRASVKDVEPDQFYYAVTEGRSFTPAVMTGTTGDTWQSQQVICADIDNDSGEKDADGNKIPIDNPLTPDEAMEVMKGYGIDPYFMYYSFSNKPGYPKFRIVLILNKALTDADQATELTARFTGIFNEARPGCADVSTKDNARLFYGGKSGCSIYKSNSFTRIKDLQALPPVEDHDTPAELPELPNFKNGVDPTFEKTKTDAKPEIRGDSGELDEYGNLQLRFEYDREHFDLAGYIIDTTGSRPVKRGNALFFNPCPLCGHNDDFQVTGSVYHCHGKNGGTGGSIIDYLMNKEGLDIGQACDKFKFEIMRYDPDEWKAAYIKRKQKEEEERNKQIEAGYEGHRKAQSSQKDQAKAAGPLPENLKGITFNDYLNVGQFEADINYFKTYKDRKMGLHSQIDKYLTLYPGLAVLGGAPSLGKTTLIVNMIDKLIERGETVLFFTLEQLPIEIITKSLAAELYREDPFTPLTNTDIKNGATCDALEAIKRKYAEKAKNYYIIPGDFKTTAADIVLYVEKFIKGHGVKPIVVIDYLQLIAPPFQFKGGIREYTDENLKTLKDMQKGNELFVIIVSSFNRSSNDEPVSYESFKETGMIEFTCDYVWGLQLKIQDAENTDFYTVIGSKGGRSARPLDERRQLVNKAQARMPKEVEFVSLKNRNGKQFFKAFFNYYPQHDYYIEADADANADFEDAGSVPFDDIEAD